MTNKIGYVWHLRRLMAEAGMFATTDLVPLLAERGVRLSREQVYRLVTGTPERLNLAVLVALCDILGCRADDLIEPVAPPAKNTAAKNTAKNTTSATAAGASVSQRPRPRRARILPAE
jgi:DNA-binding Xre family transcriptional regulator